MINKEKGLVIIYDPHALMQFLQFYCMESHRNIEWDVLCLPKENGEQVMDVYCEKSGLFNNIYKSNIEFMRLPILRKLFLFIRMLLWAAIRKQYKFSKKMFFKMGVNIDSYNYLVANCESGFMSGLMASFSNNKNVIYFEDGSADYMIERKKNQSIFAKYSFSNFQCIIISKLGYCGKGFTYFEPTKHCIKYATNPTQLMYKNYKEIHRLKIDNEGTILYQQILEKIYPELHSIKEVSDDAKIVFTMPLTYENKYRDEYIRKYVDYIANEASVIYLKKHPRENADYIFPESVAINEIPKDIPAEVIFPYFRGKECYLMEPDSLLLSMAEFDLQVKVLYFECYTNRENEILNNWKNRESFEEYCRRFINGGYEIINI